MQKPDIGKAVRTLCARWKQQKRFDQTCRALGRLDARALRDLGLDRSEILSIAAEAAGYADRQRHFNRR